jgi:hypothetical protein
MNPVLLIMRDPSRPQMPRARRDKESRHSRCIASHSLLQAANTEENAATAPAYYCLLAAGRIVFLTSLYYAKVNNCGSDTLLDRAERQRRSGFKIRSTMSVHLGDVLICKLAPAVDLVNLVSGELLRFEIVEIAVSWTPAIADLIVGRDIALRQP